MHFRNVSLEADRDIRFTMKSWIVEVLAIPFFSVTQKVLLDAAPTASFVAVEKFFRENSRG